MRIAVFDNNMRKFTQGMIDYWEAQGHSTSFLHSFHLPHAEAADVLWFDCVDGNLRTATKDHWKFLEGKTVIARAIDIDVWANHFGGIDWTKVDHLIFIAKHIQKYMLSKITLPENVKVHFIPCGVDIDKFTMRKDPTRNLEVACVMNLWSGKGIDLLWQIIAVLPDFHFNICGKWGMSSLESRWHLEYVDQFLSHYDNWSHVQRVPDMNEWLEDKTYSLTCSKKEAFGYIGHESAAKGLMPLIHEFYGAYDIWPREYLWRTISDVVVRMRHMPYKPEEYRDYVSKKYPFTRMMERFEEIICQ